MDKNIKTQNKTARNNGADKSVKNSNGTHKLNVPMSKSEMSKADKATLKAWEYTYKNRDKRVD